MSVHGGTEGTVCLIVAYESIVGQNGASVAKEGAVPVQNDVVGFASAQDVATTTTRSQIGWVVGVTVDVA